MLNPTQNAKSLINLLGRKVANPFRVIFKEDCQELCHAIFCLLKKKALKPVFTSIEFQKYRSSLRLFRHCSCYLSSVSTGWKDVRGL